MTGVADGALPAQDVSHRTARFPVGASASLDALERDPYPTYARMLEQEPISWVPALGMYYVVRYADVVAILYDPVRFTVGTDQSVLFDTFGLHMLSIDGELHDRYKSAFHEAFLPAALRTRMREHIRAHVDRLIDGFADRSHVELRSALASRLPVLTMLSLFGLPLEREPDIRRWYDSFEHALANFQWCEDIRWQAHRSVQELERVVRDRMQFYRGAPQPDALLSALVCAPAASRLSDEEIFRNTLIVMFGGVDLQPGDTVNCIIAAANRDPRKFVAPNCFDIDRPGLRQHLGFAIGPHHCLGSNLARLEGGIAIERLLARLPSWHLYDAVASAPRGSEFRRPGRLELALA